MSAWRLAATPANGGNIQAVGDLGEPVISARWQATCGDPSNAANAASKWPRLDQDLRRVKAVSAMPRGLARFAAGGRACCHFEPGNSRKPPLSGDFRGEFPDFAANFPAPAVHCDEYVCLLQQLPETWPLRGNYDNFGIALV
jgi:hypothetical protein